MLTLTGQCLRNGGEARFATVTVMGPGSLVRAGWSRDLGVRCARGVLVGACGRMAHMIQGCGAGFGSVPSACRLAGPSGWEAMVEGDL